MKTIAFLLTHKFFSSPKKLWLCVLILFLNLFTLRYSLTAESSGQAVSAFSSSPEVVYTVTDSDEYRKNCLLAAANASRILDGGYSGKTSDFIFNTAALEVYTALAEEGIPVSAVESRFFEYRWGILYLVLLCFILTASLFGDDVDSGMQMMTWTVKNGRGKLTAAKLLVLLGGIAFTVFLTEGSGLIFSGGVPLSASVQSLPGMALCPLRMTVFGYFLLSCLIRSLLLFCLSCVAASAYVLFRHVTGSALAAALFCGSSYALSLIKTDSLYSPVNCISPYHLALVSPMFSRYRMTALFGETVLVPSWKFQIAVLLASVILLAGVLTAILCRYRPGRSVSLIKPFTLPGRNKIHGSVPGGRSLSLFRLELFKALSGGGVVVLMAVFLFTLVQSLTESRELHYTE